MYHALDKIIKLFRSACQHDYCILPVETRLVRDMPVAGNFNDFASREGCQGMLSRKRLCSSFWLRAVSRCRWEHSTVKIGDSRTNDHIPKNLSA